jgi:hypothetical protein
VLHERPQHCVHFRLLALMTTPTGGSPVEEYERAADELYVRDPSTADREDTGDDGLGLCVTGASEIAARFNGRVVGYLSADNPRAALGTDEGGHDFALLNDRYIVDPWAKHVSSQARATLDLVCSEDAPLARALYGDRATWVVVRDYAANRSSS